MKSGANQQDIVQIKKLLASGSTSKEVSDGLGIELSCISSFAAVKNPINTTAKTDKPKGNPLKK